MFVSFLKKLYIKFSLKDPQWGRGSHNNNQDNNDENNNKKPDENPSDLDQLWHDFNRTLTNLFNKHFKGGSIGNNNKNFNHGIFRGTGIGISIIFIVLFLLWLTSSFFIVQEGQTAVVMTFNKYSHTTLPGFNWHWPYPIQSHEIVNISQVRTAEIGYRGNVKNKKLKESLMLTDDENIVDIQFAVQYTLKSASDWLFNNRHQNETVRQVAETAIREIVGCNKMDFVLYEGREKVALDVSMLMQQILDRYKSGIYVTNVTMQGVQPPEQVQAAFDDAVKAGQDKERQKNEGQAYANDIIPKASGAASRFLQEAEAYRARIIANAEGDTARFQQVLEEYKKAPIITRERMYLETMQQIFAKITKVLVNTKNSNNLLYLSLDKLVQQSDNIIQKTPDNISQSIINSTSSLETKRKSVNSSIGIRKEIHDQNTRDSRNREER